MLYKDLLFFLATATTKEILEKMRCGFELETVSILGANLNTLSGRTQRWAEFESTFSKLKTDRSVEFVSDGSVEGPEIRTRGPRTVKQFIDALKIVTQNQMVVNEGCSFHIHVSFPGTQWKKDDYNFMAYLQQGVLRNFQKVPESVRARWRNESAGRWCRLQAGSDRYFTAYNDLGTIEFRCWGNVSKFEDGLRCLQLTVEALRYAARCALKLAKPMLKDAMEFNSQAGALKTAIMSPNQAHFLNNYKAIENQILIAKKAVEANKLEAAKREKEEYNQLRVLLKAKREEKRAKLKALKEARMAKKEQERLAAQVAQTPVVEQPATPESTVIELIQVQATAQDSQTTEQNVA